TMMKRQALHRKSPPPRPIPGGIGDPREKTRYGPSVCTTDSRPNVAVAKRKLQVVHGDRRHPRPMRADPMRFEPSWTPHDSNHFEQLPQRGPERENGSEAGYL